MPASASYPARSFYGCCNGALQQFCEDCLGDGPAAKPTAFTEERVQLLLRREERKRLYEEEQVRLVYLKRGESPPPVAVREPSPVVTFREPGVHHVPGPYNRV
ncbi:hypothetical protein AK812_SmicGene3144 [Symbiodinium microadriaticum]|uniref:Uncharacterized protein n=1 Tax=Symbiodinium microadriaticum TaxID=2951 RepID=A0A1Q9EZL9_SYMMI|nr:hypothetical protein AK812_SmicGene3144 [Symbiodinium microadriaticum]